MRILLLLPLLCFAAGCGDDLNSIEGALAAKADAYEDLADALDGIKDKASAEAARPKVEAIMKRIEAADAAGMKHMGDLNINDMEKMGKDIDAAEKKKAEAFRNLMERIKDDPEAQAAVDRILQ